VCVCIWILEKEYCLLLFDDNGEADRGERQQKRNRKLFRKKSLEVNEVREEDEEKSRSQYGANRSEGPIRPDGKWIKRGRAVFAKISRRSSDDHRARERERIEKKEAKN
jgi:hypothetical protein